MIAVVSKIQPTLSNLPVFPCLPQFRSVGLFFGDETMAYQKPVWRPPLLAVAIGVFLWLIIIFLILRGC